jgi:hypothetical protein
MRDFFIFQRLFLKGKGLKNNSNDFLIPPSAGFLVQSSLVLKFLF